MTIERGNNQIIIRLPDTININHLQRLINYLMYQEATASSKATQEDIDQLARDVNKGWWEQNKDRFIHEE